MELETLTALIIIGIMFIPMWFFIMFQLYKALKLK